MRLNSAWLEDISSFSSYFKCYTCVSGLQSRATRHVISHACSSFQLLIVLYLSDSIVFVSIRVLPFVVNYSVRLFILRDFTGSTLFTFQGLNSKMTFLNLRTGNILSILFVNPDYFQ